MPQEMETFGKQAAAAVLHIELDTEQHTHQGSEGDVPLLHMSGEYPSGKSCRDAPLRPGCARVLCRLFEDLLEPPH